MTIPPLLAIAAGRRARPRRAKPTSPKEIVLHMAVADLLRKHCRPTWRWAHIPSGELRTKATGAKLKRMGAPVGWPDFLLLAPTSRTRSIGLVDTLYCLELKRDGEDLSEAQEAFKSWCLINSVPHSVASTMFEVRAILAHWRCLTPEAEAACLGGR